MLTVEMDNIDAHLHTIHGDAHISRPWLLLLQLDDISSILLIDWGALEHCPCGSLHLCTTL